MPRCYGASSVQSISLSRGIVQVRPLVQSVPIAHAHVTDAPQPLGRATQLHPGVITQHAPDST